MQMTGIVRKTENNSAVVVVKRQSACGENCAGCGGCTQKENEVVAENTVGAKPGDCVVIEMANAKILKAAFLVYILPLILFIISYVAFFSIGMSEGVSILAGVVFAGVFYILLHLKDKKNAGKYMHKIIRTENF